MGIQQTKEKEEYRDRTRDKKDWDPVQYQAISISIWSPDAL